MKRIRLIPKILLLAFFSLIGPGLHAGPENSEKTKMCFECRGLGVIKCPEPSCRNGEADCPGPCLKLSQGNWIHMEVANHPPTDIWRKFMDQDDLGWQAWNQNHVGDVIEYRNGKPVNV